MKLSIDGQAETLAILDELLTDPSYSLSSSNPYSGLMNTNYAQMGLSAGTAAINTMGQIWSGVVTTNAQKRQWGSQGEIEDKRMNMIIQNLNTEMAKLDVVERQTDLRNVSRHELAEAQSKLDVVKAEVAEEKATREASKINMKELNRLFEDNRRQRSLGKPVLPIPESRGSRDM